MEFTEFVANLLGSPTHQMVESLNLRCAYDAAVLPVPHTVWENACKLRQFAEQDGREELNRLTAWTERVREMAVDREARLQEALQNANAVTVEQAVEVLKKWHQENPGTQPNSLDAIQREMDENIAQQKSLRSQAIDVYGGKREQLEAAIHKLSTEFEQLSFQKFFVEWGI
ncbi:MAG TPA: hypothetical protein V6D07_18715 [Trichocoleus sp.]